MRPGDFCPDASFTEFQENSCRADGNRSDLHTAGDLDALGIDPAEIIRPQAGDRRPTSCSTPARPIAVWSATIRLTAGLSRTTPPEKIGGDSAGCNDVDADPPGSRFLRHVAAERFDGSLRRAVYDAAVHRYACEARRDGDDPAAVVDQRQKRLRQQEDALEVGIELQARRLMASQGSNVEAAAFLVGHESPSQFGREYSRMFG
jgi:hypothetical protein